MKIYLISFLISIAILIAAILAVYEIADYTNPPVTAEGKRYMPTENVFIALIYGFFSAILSFFISVRILRRRLEK